MKERDKFEILNSVNIYFLIRKALDILFGYSKSEFDASESSGLDYKFIIPEYRTPAQTDQSFNKMTFEW